MLSGLHVIVGVICPPPLNSPSASLAGGIGKVEGPIGFNLNEALLSRLRYL